MIRKFLKSKKISLVNVPVEQNLRHSEKNSPITTDKH